MLKKNKSIFKKIHLFIARFSNFSEVFNYVIHWSVKGSKLKHFIAVFLLSMGGALNIIAILLISVLFNLIGEPNSINSYLPNSLSLVNFSISFTSGAILIFCTFLIGALFTFTGHSLVLRLATDLEKKLTINLFNLVKIQDVISKIFSNRSTKSKLYKSLLSSTRLSGRILRMQLALIQPLLQSVVLMTVLMIMNLKVTIYILLATIALSTIQYLISIRAVKFSRKFEKSNRESKDFLKSKIQLILNDNNVKNLSSNILKNKSFQESKSDYRMRIQVTEESKLASSIIKACIIFILLVTMTKWGSDISVPTLKTLFNYALILVFFLISLQTLLALITSINRFYPQVREYINLESEIKRSVDYDDYIK